MEGWRKLLISLVAIIGVSVLCGMDKLTGEMTLGIYTAVLATFTYGNVKEHKYKNNK